MRKIFFFKVQCFPYFHDKTRSRVGSSDPLLNINFRSNMIMNLNILAATIRSFKVLIDYTLDLTPPSPPAPIPPPKERRWRNCFKIPTSTGIVVAHVVVANTPSKFFCLHLGTNFLSFDWDLLAFSFSNLFLFSFLSTLLPLMLFLKSSHQSWVQAILRHE